MHLRNASGSQTVSNFGVRNASGMQMVKNAYVRNSTGSHLFYSSAPAVSVSPSYVSGAGYSRTPITVSTIAATVTAPAGSTFAWASPDTGWSAINPMSAATGFRKTAVAAGVEADTTFTCTITLPGGSTTTVTVTADVSNTYESTE